MFRRMLTLLLTLNALTAMASSAVAAPITTSTSSSFLISDELATAGGTTATLVFDKFDAGLGTLLGVDVSFDPWESTLFIAFPSPSTPASVNVSLTATVDGLPFTAPFPYEFAHAAFGCVSCPPVEIETKQGSLTYTYPQAIVSPFIGDGTLPVAVTVLLAGSAQNADVTGSWSGLFNVIYTYEPAPPTTPPTSVPEPGSLLLFGLGVAVTGVAVRRPLQRICPT